MTYPARPARSFQPLRRSTRWLTLALVTLALTPGCSDDAGQTEALNPGTPSTTGSTTMTVTTGSVTSATTGSAASTTGATSVSTVGATSSSASTTGSSTTSGTTTGASTTSSGTTGSMSSTGSTSSGTDTSSGSGAGGSGGGGATTTGGGPGFQPCPDTPPCKVLPLGDSITFGLGYDGGYRVELFRLAVTDGHEITFTGTQQPNGPAMVEGVTFPRTHAGISGQLIAEIGGRVPNPEFENGAEMPHIILVHAGTNDIVRSRDGAEGRLEALMDKLIAEAPDALLVFSNLIPLSFGGVEDFNDPIPAMVEERANAGAHIIFADQYTGFPTEELGDGVHPNQAGYQRMAGVWYEAIEPYLP